MDDIYVECPSCKCVYARVAGLVLCPIKSCKKYPLRRRLWLADRYAELRDHLGKDHIQTYTFYHTHSKDLRSL